MVVPLVTGAIAVGSAVAQYMQSEEARALSAEERERLEALIAGVQSPNFSWEKLDPKTYAVVAKYQPQVASFIQEKAPEVTKMASQDAVMAREAQREALTRLRAQGAGQDPLGDAELAENLSQAAVANRGRNQAVKEDFARRGQGGGTSEMLAQMLGTQQANEQAATGSRQAYIEAQRRKLQALRDSSSLAGSIRDDEFRVERGNNDIINSFNQRTATRQQGWADNAAGIANDASKYNLGNEQDTANRNVGAANQFAVQGQQREDDLKQRGFTNDMAKVKAQAGITDMARDDIVGGARDRNAAIAGGAEGAQTVLKYSDRQPAAKAPTQEQQTGQTSAASSLSAKPQYSVPNEDDEDGNPLNRRYRPNQMGGY